MSNIGLGCIPLTQDTLQVFRKDKKFWQNYEYFYSGVTIALCMANHNHNFSNYAQKYLPVIVLLRPLKIRTYVYNHDYWWVCTAT